MPLKPTCIIPARGGSKRIPRKNIVDFNGKPLIAWSIETALVSGIFERVVVSTDDEEISNVARHYGAEVPFMRDANLADDFATTADVLINAIGKLPKTEYTCCLYPTAPMITAENLSSSYKKLIETKADCVVSVTDFDFHPLRAFEVGKSGNLSFKWPEYALTRSQDLPEMVHDAGAFYFFNTSAFLTQNKLVMQNTVGIELSRLQAVDIDEPQDLELARILHQKNLLESKNVTA